jgi:hypothetical protein
MHQSANHCRLLRGERLALEKHAREKGCRLIINPEIPYERTYGLPARIVRLQWLVRFLRSMPPGKAQAAFNPAMPNQRNLTIVGNWFAAESVSAAAGQGYRHTIFTRHAPSVESQIELFDEEFKEALKAKGWTARSSCACAIRALESLINELKKREEAREANKA